MDQQPDYEGLAKLIIQNAGDKLACHYGIWINKDMAITGVIHNQTAEWFTEECMYNSVDLDWEEHEAECPNEYHDDCYWNDGTATLLVGSWKKDDQGLYEPDKTGEYAAISGEINAQIVWSKYTRRCALCSPCYPGQGDLDTPGEFLAYDLPPDVYGAEEEQK